MWHYYNNISRLSLCIISWEAIIIVIFMLETSIIIALYGDYTIHTHWLYTCHWVYRCFRIASLCWLCLYIRGNWCDRPPSLYDLQFVTRHNSCNSHKEQRNCTRSDRGKWSQSKFNCIIVPCMQILSIHLLEQLNFGPSWCGLYS